MVKANDRGSVHHCGCLTCQQHPQSRTAQDHRILNRLVSATDEQSRRLLVGFLAQQHGRGGIALLARITGLTPHTIRRGWRELRQHDLAPAGRIRRPGAGRKPVEANNPKS
jgi:hypothetical protein